MKHTDRHSENVSLHVNPKQELKSEEVVWILYQNVSSFSEDNIASALGKTFL